LPETAARAKASFDLGTQHYALREYPAAIEAFHRAYELLPEPAFLFNLAQAYRQLHQCADARSYYRSYLRDLPTAGNRAKVEIFIAEMDACARRQPEVIQPINAPPVVVSDRRGLRAAGLVAAVVGSVVAGGGVYFSMDAADRARELEQQCLHGCRASDVAAIDRNGQRSARAAIVMYGVGGATVATGVGMILWATLRDGPAPVTIRPEVGGATLSAAVRF
jgi:tetratricopeptide (TPR) repeat protein